MKYIFIIVILGCLGAGIVFAADPVTDPDQFNRAAYLPQGKETSASCKAKNSDSQACHGTCIPKDQICLNVPIAGKNTFPSFQEYFQTIYSFILGAVAILSTVMVMWGGFKWLTSRGSQGDIGEAKKIITSSIIGLVLAFLSFTILYLVNPKLTVIGLPQLKTVEFAVNEAELKSYGSRGVTYGDASTGGAHSTGTYCQNRDVADFGSGRVQALPPAVNNFNADFEQYGKEYGVPAKILRAIAAQESGGDPQVIGPDTSYGNACGLMQLLPSTASAELGREVSCDELRNNPQLSIQIAAKHVASHQAGLDLQDVFAGYNGGYGTTPNANGLLPALAPSRGCSDQQAYECCKGPGGLSQTQDYVWKTLGYYNGQK